MGALNKLELVLGRDNPKDGRIKVSAARMTDETEMGSPQAERLREEQRIMDAIVKLLFETNSLFSEQWLGEAIHVGRGDEDVMLRVFTSNKTIGRFETQHLLKRDTKKIEKKKCSKECVAYHIPNKIYKI